MSTNEVGLREKPRTTLEEYEAKLASINQDWNGAEQPSDVPIAPPIGYKAQPSMVEIVRQAIRSEHLRQEALRAEAETFEEADDFDVPDDPLPPQGYEMFEPQFEPEVRPAGARPDAPAPPPAAPTAAPAAVPPAPAAVAPGDAPAGS